MKSLILVVEDDRVIRSNVVELLSEEGYDAISASDGGDGLALAQARIPDLIVCDIALPTLDGFELLRAVRADPRMTAKPFIFLTARSERADVSAGMRLGADDYLSKPFTADELLDAIRTRLERLNEILTRTQAAL